MPTATLTLFALATGAAAAPRADLLDASYPRTTAAALRAEARINDAPQVPFVNFSDGYVQAALSSPTDWVARGAVTAVKDQGLHGYCGTFGRVGSAEGQWALRSGQGLASFSEEMLIDCIGWDRDQYSYFAPRGFMTSAAYPYNESAYPDQDPPIPGNPCKFDARGVVKGTAGFFTFRTGEAPDEAQLAAFIHHNGPVSAGIDASVFALREPGCEARGDCFINATACASVSPSIDHSILLVGYGTDPVRGPFWKIKNSWSTQFANQGYINVARGVACAGLCGDPSICGNVFGHGSNASYTSDGGAADARRSQSLLQKIVLIILEMSFFPPLAACC